MPAMSSPYSTADAPVSSRRRSWNGRWPRCLRTAAITVFMSVGVASAGVGAAVGDLGAGVREDVVERATEGEDDDHDEGRDAGDEQAVLDGGGAAFLHLGEAGVEDDAEVVQHVSSLLKIRGPCADGETS